MTRDVLLQILDLARWAPSGDNTQPWRFAIADDQTIFVYGNDTRAQVLYDFDGHPSQMAHGALLETLRLAATRFGLEARWRIRPGQPEHAPVYEVSLHPGAIAEDPLVAHIEQRSVQRRAMQLRRLQPEQQAALSAAVGEDFSLRFCTTFGERLAVARLLWDNAYLRLTCPEAYPVHRDIIEWNARYSADRIPDQAVGVDALTTLLMRWVMQSWQRVDFFNRYLFGTVLPRIELDFVPALACSAHLLLRPRLRPATLADRLAAGAALQRLWLTACSQGLHLQPEMTPVIFRWYVQGERKISHKPEINAGAVTLARRFERITGSRREDPFAFFCRVGQCAPPRSRSLRRELRELLRD